VVVVEYSHTDVVTCVIPPFHHGAHIQANNFVTLLRGW